MEDAAARSKRRSKVYASNRRPDVCEIGWYCRLHLDKVAKIDFDSIGDKEVELNIPTKKPRPMVVLAIDSRGEMLVYPLTHQDSGTHSNERWLGKVDGRDQYMMPLPDRTHLKLVTGSVLNIDPLMKKDIVRKCVDRALVVLPVEATESESDKFSTVLDGTVGSPVRALSNS